ncbi:BTB domain-containing protein [Favolaschia claudopus]|uniref:BTB domain-containing protein n=1 Tax=Favolaschia claudopus TaxID=2862362 RepID=A0AAW0DZR1_9AGAR
MNLETPSMQSSDDSESDDTSRSQAPSFNPAFDSPDGDIGTPILSAKGGNTFFRIHSFILKTTSSWFRTMLSLPQGQSSPVEVIFMEEDEDTLELLLRMISGLPLLPIVHYDVVDKILFAAEKYDMPGPIGVIRLLVMTPPFLDSPFRLYTVACRYGWEEEARFASTQTLAHHLHDPQVRQGLRRLSTDALLDLISLHHSRKESLRDRLNKPPFVASENAASTCGNCNAPLDYHTWRILKFRMIQEIEIRPLGDTILDKGLVDWPEAKACWLAKCPNRVCARSLYDQEPTMRIIKECIDELPRSI